MVYLKLFGDRFRLFLYFYNDGQVQNEKQGQGQQTGRKSGNVQTEILGQETET